MRKTITAAVPVLACLVAAPGASALPESQTFAGRSGEPEAGAAVPVRANHGQALPPKTGKTPPKPKPKVARVQTPPHLQAIAACESGGNPRAVDSTGTYRGKYQFTVQTWQGVGGSGDPAHAPEAEQDRRAAALYARSGAGQWPVCGR